MSLAVEVHDLVKDYRTKEGRMVRALNGIRLDIPTGTLVGILGPNGAGKTTLLKLLHAAWPPTSGTLRILGHDPQRDARRLKARLGVVPQDNNLDPDFNLRRNLTTYARYFGIERAEAHRRADELLRFVGLTERARDDIDSLSGGMKRRLILARSLINDPDLILLDEPTTGLDPQARHLVWEKIRDLRRRGKTLLLTTHYMDEAEQLCDQVVLIDQGRIHSQGTPRELIERYASRDVLELAFATDAQPHLAPLNAIIGDRIQHAEAKGNRIYVYTTDAEAVLHAARGRLPIEESRIRRATLEDVFLRLTGRELRE